jgi:nucleoside-diphosphate-sugar epimerase
VISAVCGTVAGWLGKSSTLNPDKYNIMKQRNWRCDIRPARQDLGFNPQYSLARGVKEAMDWYKQEGWI